MTEARARALSLNEVEQLSLKAARGAGASWGVAEDIGRAARWLAARGIGWAPFLLALLAREPPAEPFMAALAVADRLARARPDNGWHVEGCPPGWLLAVMAAARPTLPLCLDWQTSRAILRPDGAVELDRPTDRHTLSAPATATHVAVVADAGPLPHTLGIVMHRGHVDLASLADLEALAFRTAVPSSARSRTAGAGGGRVDDD